MDYMTANEIADKWGITRRWVLMYCMNGRIEGAIKKGNMWLIPLDAEKPADLRKRNKDAVIEK